MGLRILVSPKVFSKISVSSNTKSLYPNFVERCPDSDSVRVLYLPLDPLFQRLTGVVIRSTYNVQAKRF